MSDAPPEWLTSEYTDLDVPDLPDDFDEPPDWLPTNYDDLDVPPDDFRPPAYLVDIPAEVLALPPELDWENAAASALESEPLDPDMDAALNELFTSNWPPPNELDNETIQASILQEAQTYEAEAQALTADPYGLANEWITYSEAVIAGENLGGSETDLIERAEAMNLVDARFLGRTEESGYVVSAIEVAADVSTGDLYGQVMDVHEAETIAEAEAIYEMLQGHVDDNTLPNYAVADFASHVADGHGRELEWREAGPQDFELYQAHIGIDSAANEPPEQAIDQMIEEYTGVDLSSYTQESLFEYAPEVVQPLDYTLHLNTALEGGTGLEVVKEWDGGLRSGGDEEHRMVGLYPDYETAAGLAQDLYNMQQDITALADSQTAGWQAIVSAAYELGQANGMIAPEELLFQNGPADPFEVQPTDQLFAEYELQPEVELTPSVEMDM